MRESTDPAVRDFRIQVLASCRADCQREAERERESLKGFPLREWTVDASSDTVPRIILSTL